MKGTRPAHILLPPADDEPGSRSVAGAAGDARPSPAPAGGGDELDETGRIVFEALRRHRLALARQEAVPPYVIASDRTLRDVARLRPRTVEELRLVHGIGSRKAERYGAGLLQVVADSR
jgi:ATP-dependent DNA helicase RecQ